LLVLHRSGFNTTDRMRRAYVTHYSPELIYGLRTVGPDGVGKPMHLGVPCLRAGRNVFEAAVAEEAN
jgi:hypothetical protein